MNTAAMGPGHRKQMRNEAINLSQLQEAHGPAPEYWLHLFVSEYEQHLRSLQARSFIDWPLQHYVGIAGIGSAQGVSSLLRAAQCMLCFNPGMPSQLRAVCHTVQCFGSSGKTRTPNTEPLPELQTVPHYWNKKENKNLTSKSHLWYWEQLGVTHNL